MFSIIQSYLNEDYKIVLSLSKNEHINTAQEGLYKLGQRCEIVHEFSLPETKVGLTALSLPQGFVLPDEKNCLFN